MKNRITELKVWVVETMSEGDIAACLSVAEADAFAKTYTELTDERCVVTERKAIIQFTRKPITSRKSA